MIVWFLLKSFYSSDRQANAWSIYLFCASFSDKWELNYMQILIFEDSTCVLNLYMIVAAGFVSNLLCKWIHGASNWSETLSTLRERNFCVNFPCRGLNSLILQFIVRAMSVKYIKAPGQAGNIYVTRAVMYYLGTLPKSRSFFPYSYLLTSGAVSFLRSCQCAAIHEIPNNFKEPEVSSPCSQFDRVHTIPSL
jgi:hypothetical protein